MKAAQITSYGGPEVMSVTEIDKPALTEGQVLVEVCAAAVNPFDVKVRDGVMRHMKDLDFPATLGGDVAGTVSEVGSGVTGFEVGEAVYGQANALSGHGSFAEYAPVKAESLAAKPVSLDFVNAAAVPLTAVSAYQALTDHMDLQTGQKILIHGGAGGIGTMAIQLAKQLGAYIATTATAADTEYVQSLGADEVIDYQNQDFTEIVHAYDAVYDTVGGETNAKSYQLLKPGGTLVSMVEQPNDELLQQHGIHYTFQFTKVTTERLASIAKLVDAGTLKVNVDKVFPLDQAAEALEYLATGHPRGKVVIQVKP